MLGRMGSGQLDFERGRQCGAATQSLDGNFQ